MSSAGIPGTYVYDKKLATRGYMWLVMRGALSTRETVTNELSKLVRSGQLRNDGPYYAIPLLAPA